MKKFLIGLLCLMLSISAFSFAGCLDVVKNPSNSDPKTESSQDTGDKNEDSSSKGDEDEGESSGGNNDNSGDDGDDGGEEKDGWTKPY